MNTFVTALADDITVASLWGAISGVAALVGVGILVGFSYHVAKKAVSGLGKGKAKI